MNDNGINVNVARWRTDPFTIGWISASALLWFIVTAVGADLRVIKPFPGLDSPAIIWGAETNGAKAGVFLSSTNPPEIVVFVSLNPDTNLPSSVGHTPAELNRSEKGIYFRATNSTCALMELRDESGKLCPPRETEIASPGNFPPSYSLRHVAFTFARKYSIYSGPTLPPVSFKGGPLASIALADYFQPAKEGNYQLTVWPKIYRRSFIESDKVERLDLPGATVVFHWPGPNQRVTNDSGQARKGSTQPRP